MKTSLPPGPRAPSSVQTAAWFTRPVPFQLRARERYGDVFTMQVAVEPPWVVLGHPDHVREVFTGSPQQLLAGEGNAVLQPILGDRSVLLLDRQEHLRARKLLLPPFHGARMQRYTAAMREIAEAEIARWPLHAEFALGPRMASITLEIILRAVFGVRDAQRLVALRAALEELMELVVSPSTFVVAGLLGLDRATRLPVFRRRMERVDALLYEELREHRAAADLGERDDILSLLLLARDEDGQPISDEAARDELMTLLVAGHETTATALAWAFERLLRHPESLARLVESARKEDDAYGLAVAYETLRLRPVIPLVLRTLAEPMTIAGYDLPAGVKVAPSVVLVHRREDLYPEPHAFRPERFLGVTPGTYTWIPFGGGVRRCLGASFALLELQVVLGAVARSAHLQAVGDGSEGVVRRAITFAPKRGAAVVRTPQPA